MADEFLSDIAPLACLSRCDGNFIGFLRLFHFCASLVSSSPLYQFNLSKWNRAIILMERLLLLWWFLFHKRSLEREVLLTTN